MPHTLNCWVILSREEGLAGWVAHVLDLDVVTQGDTLAHAIEMALEAAAMVIHDDAERGLNPLDRRAPAEAWDALHALQREALPTRPEWFRGATDEEGIESAALQIRVEVGATRSLEPVWVRQRAA